MVTMSIWHPSVEEFITAKQTPGRLTKFNMSVLITDAFMKAVENHAPWNLEFPVTDVEQYDAEWDGDLDKWKSKGYPTQVWKTYADANELWDLIMTSTYNRNEPGVLFVDTINRLNPLHYCEHITATNPCGEQVLPIGAVCLLGSFNLTQYVDLEKGDWDYAKLSHDIPIAVRMLDNVNDITYVPLEIQRENLKGKRRIGLGYMGYGSALFMLKVRYGSERALQLTEDLAKFVINTEYKASALLAKEKGAFPLYDAEKYLKGAFVKSLEPDTIEFITKWGLRNSHLGSIQPTGNSSIYANNVSGGLEPIFLPEFVRTAMQSHPPDGLHVPIVDWTNKTYKCESKWDWAKEGDESLLVINFNGVIYKFDKSRGLLKETKVKDYAVRMLEKTGEWDPQAEWASDASKLSIEDHVKTMKVFSKYIDSAMSKTVNLPNDYPYEDFKRLYTEVFKTGTIKGCTTYRQGTMTAVLSAESTAAAKAGTKIIKNTAPKRPDRLPCDVHHLQADGIKWVVLVGILGDDPYEVFSLRQDKMRVSPNIDKAVIIKNGGGAYDLEFDDGTVIHNISRFHETGEQTTVARLMSASLRHGTDIKFIVDQLMKSEGSVVSFSKSIARTLKKYIDGTQHTFKCSECGSKKVEMSEGCFKCKDCGSSKCS